MTISRTLEPKRNVESNHTNMVGLMALNVFTGFVAHRVLYGIFERTFTHRSSRLMSFATGMIVDILLSFAIIREHEKENCKSDRRQTTLTKFDQYLFGRGLSAMTLGAGVLFGYMLDDTA